MRKVIFVLIGLLLSVSLQMLDGKRLIVYSKFVNCWNSTEFQDCFVEAIAWKESKLDSLAIGDSGRSVGYLQIQEICVREVNRLEGTSFCYQDRFSKELSKEMFYILQKHKNPDFNFERALKVWNPGHPKEYLVDIKERYFYNVKCLLDESLY